MHIHIYEYCKIRQYYFKHSNSSFIVSFKKIRMPAARSARANTGDHTCIISLMSNLKSKSKEKWKSTMRRAEF